ARHAASALLLDDLLLARVQRLVGRTLVTARLYAVGVLGGGEGRTEGVVGLGQRLLGVVVPVLALPQRVEEVLLVAVHVVDELRLEAGDVADGDVVEPAGGPGPDRDDLLLDRVGVGLLLL